ncbi:MAG: hypothetical protein AAF250_16245 [Pseudomonadota bacterium]
MTDFGTAMGEMSPFLFGLGSDLQGRTSGATMQGLGMMRARQEQRRREENARALLEKTMGRAGGAGPSSGPIPATPLPPPSSSAAPQATGPSGGGALALARERLNEMEASQGPAAAPTADQGPDDPLADVTRDQLPARFRSKWFAAYAEAYPEDAVKTLMGAMARGSEPKTQLAQAIADHRAGFLSKEELLGYRQKLLAGDQLVPLALHRRATAAGLTPGSPEYREFMFNGGPGSNGITYTTPDGSTIQIGGTRGQNDGLSKSGYTNVEKQELAARDGVARLNAITAELADPAFMESLTGLGGLRARGLALADKWIPGSLSEEQTQWLSSVSGARSKVLTNVNKTIQALTGAAMGQQEAQRIIGTLPNPDDSPTQFMAKLQSAVEMSRAAVARYELWRREGLGGSPRALGSIEDIQRQMNARAEELARQVDSGDMSMEEAEAAFSAEFGV